MNAAVLESHKTFRPEIRSTMADDNSDKLDKRMMCKYGVKCYQKNPEHHKKFKHPQRRVQEQIGKLPPAKRAKIEPISQKNNNDDTELSVKVKTSKFCTLEKTPNVSNNNHNEFGTNTSYRPYKELNPDAFIKEKFLVNMPDDFYKFWEFCTKLNDRNPSAAFKDAGLILCGPFDVLNGKFINARREFSQEEFLVHWRYFRDPPEFQTVVRGTDSNGYHIGYFRDDPNDKFTFMASNAARENGIFKQIGGNIFAAIFLYLKEKEKTCNPFVRMKISTLLNRVKHEAETLKYSLESKTEEMKSRNRKVLAKTFNEIGIVAPYDKATSLGYRPLAMEDDKLRRHLQILKDREGEDDVEISSELDSLFNWTTIAMDESDFATAVELGLNVLSHDINRLNSTITTFLTNAYTLLNRHQFADIIQAHMKFRRNGFQLSILPEDSI